MSHQGYRKKKKDSTGRLNSYTSYHEDCLSSRKTIIKSLKANCFIKTNISVKYLNRFNWQAVSSCTGVQLTIFLGLHITALPNNLTKLHSDGITVLGNLHYFQCTKIKVGSGNK